MPDPAIRIRALEKTYIINEREAGLLASLRSLVARKTKKVRAVNGISFDIEPGEIVGFLGPNGAGKTTTLKMLSGLLYPTSGEMEVLGYRPYERKNDFLRQITLVMGQRNQLVWDIPAIDTFELIKTVYQIPAGNYKATLGELTDLLGLADLLKKPVRNLSLGERMKCEIAGALLHLPQVVFLDEPTLGLDITAQRRIREFVREYNQRYNATVILTSHYMADVEALSRRVIIIHHGQLLFDGKLPDLIEKYNPHKTITVDLESPGHDLSSFGEVIRDEGVRIVLRVAKENTARITGQLLVQLPVHDLTVDDPPIEDTIEAIFALPDKNNEKHMEKEAELDTE